MIYQLKKTLQIFCNTAACVPPRALSDWCSFDGPGFRLASNYNYASMAINRRILLFDALIMI